MASLLDDFVVYGRPKRHPSNVRFAFLAQTRPSQTKTSCSAVMWQRWLWNTWGPSEESFDDRVGNIKARLPAPLESNKCFRARKAKNETGVNPLDLVHNLLFFWKSSNIAIFFLIFSQDDRLRCKTAQYPTNLLIRCTLNASKDSTVACRRCSCWSWSRCPPWDWLEI